LMSQAQEQARELFAGKDDSYRADAMRSIGRQLRSLLGLFDIQVEILWREAAPEEGLTVGERAGRLIGVAEEGPRLKRQKQQALATPMLHTRATHRTHQSHQSHQSCGTHRAHSPNTMPTCRAL